MCFLFNKCGHKLDFHFTAKGNTGPNNKGDVLHALLLLVFKSRNKCSLSMPLSQSLCVTPRLGQEIVVILISNLSETSE